MKATDKFEKAQMVIIRRDMTAKLTKLRLLQTKYQDALQKKFTDEDFRNLNVVNHHIECAKARMNGEWMNDDTPEVFKIV